MDGCDVTAVASVLGVMLLRRYCDICIGDQFCLSEKIVIFRSKDQCETGRRVDEVSIMRCIAPAIYQSRSLSNIDM